MKKAFRNSGIEGGVGSLAFQKMLWGAERSAQYYAQKTRDPSVKWNISAAKEKPVKQEASWNFSPDMKSKAILLKYASAESPALCGSWAASVKLWGLGLIALVTPPKRWVSYGPEQQPVGHGALFEITWKGRKYLDFLKSKGD